MGALPTDQMERFSAVVLEHEGVGRLKWSAAHRDWLRHDTKRWRAKPVSGDRATPEQLKALPEVIDGFLASGACRRCGYRALPETHYIAPDVVERPTVYCMQMPPLDVVESRGGHGRVKYWGSPHGCHAVNPDVVHGPVPTVGDYRAVLAGFVYGRPLPAEEAMVRDWCERWAVSAYLLRDEPGDAHYGLFRVECGVRRRVRQR